MNFAISVSDRDPNGHEGIEGYRIGRDETTPIGEKRLIVTHFTLQHYPLDILREQISKQPDDWVDRMFNSIQNRCYRCNVNKSCHSYRGADSSYGERLCCKCYIKAGGTPADWHPDCVQESSRT